MDNTLKNNPCMIKMIVMPSVKMTSIMMEEFLVPWSVPKSMMRGFAAIACCQVHVLNALSWHPHDTIQSFAANRVLGPDLHPPPEISSEETNLPRIARARLSQLRSGFSRLLKSHMHRLDGSIEDKCPNCQISPPWYSPTYSTAPPKLWTCPSPACWPTP